VVLFNWKKYLPYFKLMISLCGGIHLNTGPAKCLCGKCGCSVSEQEKALCCDGCDK